MVNLGLRDIESMAEYNADDMWNMLGRIVSACFARNRFFGDEWFSRLVGTGYGNESFVSFWILWV